MSVIAELALGFANRRVPVILQTEAAECGLACVAMITSFHGHRVDLPTLRGRYPVSLKGATLADLVQVAEQLQLVTRALKLEINNLRQLQLPCILHWNFDHYVVLKRVRRNAVVVHDPAFGERKLTMGEFSRSFTGVALELWPNPGFRRKNELRKVALRPLLGRVTGLFKSFGRVILLALALEVFAIVAPFYIQWVVDQAIVNADRDLLTTLAVGFGLLAVMKAVVGAVRSWVVMHMSTILSVQWRANVFAHLLSLPVQYFQKRHLGDIVSRFGSIEQIQNTLTTSFLEALLDGLMALVTLIMMVVYSRLLAAIAALTMLLYALSRWAWYGALRSATSSQIVFAAKQQSNFLESVRGVRTIKLFGRESQRRATWLSILIDQLNAGLRSQKLQILYSSINGLLIGIETILVVWFGARMILDGEFSVGALMAFRAYDDQFATRTSSLIDKLFQFQMLKLYGERLADIVLSEPEYLPSNESCNDGPEPPADIRISNLRFRYSEHEPFVLDGVSFQISEGETVALAGPSGCGKSTLLGVLIGVLPPTSGDIEVGGMSLRRLGPQRLRQMIGTVLQDDVLFAGSIKENVSFFDPNADLGWIIECATRAGVHAEITAMPMGYNSLVGDMGTVLSGGQKQRVLLARALYKRPKILILDEATSQLDVETERLVTGAVEELKVTRLIVAHRPETIAAASRVVTLRNGKVASDAQRTPLPAVAPDIAVTLPKAPDFLRLPSAHRRTAEH